MPLSFRPGTGGDSHGASTGTICMKKCGRGAKSSQRDEDYDSASDFDALHSEKIHLQDEVTTSAHAKSMGSRVFLEEGEVQTVETLIKCIVIASGNDASVANGRVYRRQ